MKIMICILCLIILQFTGCPQQAAEENTYDSNVEAQESSESSETPEKASGNLQQFDYHELPGEEYYYYLAVDSFLQHCKEAPAAGDEEIYSFLEDEAIDQFKEYHDMRMEMDVSSFDYTLAEPSSSGVASNFSMLYDVGAVIYYVQQGEEKQTEVLFEVEKIFGDNETVEWKICGIEPLSFGDACGDFSADTGLTQSEGAEVKEDHGQTDRGKKSGEEAVITDIVANASYQMFYGSWELTDRIFVDRVPVRGIEYTEEELISARKDFLEAAPKSIQLSQRDILLDSEIFENVSYEMMVFPADDDYLLHFTLSLRDIGLTEEMGDYFVFVRVKDSDRHIVSEFFVKDFDTIIAFQNSYCIEYKRVDSESEDLEVHIITG